MQKRLLSVEIGRKTKTEGSRKSVSGRIVFPSPAVANRIKRNS